MVSGHVQPSWPHIENGMVTREGSDPLEMRVGNTPPGNPLCPAEVLRVRGI